MAFLLDDAEVPAQNSIVNYYSIVLSCVGCQRFVDIYIYIYMYGVAVVVVFLSAPFETVWKRKKEGQRVRERNFCIQSYSNEMG